MVNLYLSLTTKFLPESEHSRLFRCAQDATEWKVAAWVLSLTSTALDAQMMEL